MKEKGCYFELKKKVTLKIDMYKVKSFMLINCGLGQKNIISFLDKENNILYTDLKHTLKRGTTKKNF